MKHFLALIGGLGVFSGASFGATLPTRPNILVILADDLGFSDLGCYGSDIRTPNLDSLAKDGLRFAQFYNTARCWPTRSALLTGFYPQQTHSDPNRGRLPPWTRTLPQWLRPLGYRSYHSGKWHVNGAPNPVADAGFDHSYDLEDHDRNFNPQKILEDDRPVPPVAKNSSYYTTTAFADHAVRCLQEHAREHAARPFFSYLAFTVPHFPLQAPPEDIARYRDQYLRGWDKVREERWSNGNCSTWRSIVANSTTWPPTSRNGFGPWSRAGSNSRRSSFAMPAWPCPQPAPRLRPRPVGQSEPDHRVARASLLFVFWPIT